jgi:7-cyano-7-deazaguanine synthase
MSKAIVLLSGGMDSATVLALATNKHKEVVAVNIYYGQVNDRELECAQYLADYYEVPYVALDLSETFSNFQSSLLSVCHLDITDDGKTYVPARNSIFLSIAAGYADSTNAKHIYYGAHKEDAGGYPDTTMIYYVKMKRALEEGTKNRVQLEAPFISKTKEEIVRTGMRLRVPFEHTHSCYKNQNPPCGECPTCKLRAKAFKNAGYIDPLTLLYTKGE